MNREFGLRKVYRTPLLFGVCILTLLFSPNSLTALDYNSPDLSEFQLSLPTLPSEALLPPPLEKKPLPREAGKFNEWLQTVEVSARNASVAATSLSVKAEELLQGLRAVIQSIRVPEIPLEPNPSRESVNPISIPTPTPSTPPSEAPPASPVPSPTVTSGSNLSALSRILNLEAQLASLRLLITRQSDRNVESARHVVTEVITERVDNISGATITGSTFSGSATLTSTTTADNGINITDGCFAIDGTCLSTSGGATSPGGSDTQVQFNNGGSFGGDAGFIYNTATDQATLTNIVLTKSTTTQATTTSFAISGISSSLLKTNSIGSLVAAVAGTDYENPLTFSTGLTRNTNTITVDQTFSPTWTGTHIFNNITRSTTTAATTTNLFSTTASSTNLFATAFTVGNMTSTGLGTFTSLRATASSTIGGGTTSTGLTVAGQATTTNLIVTASSTLQNFSFVNATGTSATTTNFFSTTASSTNLFTSNLTVGGGSITYTNRATTTIPALSNGWSIGTSTTAGSVSVLSFSNISSTSTIHFFGATTTGLVAGSGLALPSNLKQQLIIGDGKTPAHVAIVNGSLCVDKDGWCTASSTAATGGEIAAIHYTTAATDLAEMYPSMQFLEPGDLIAAGTPSTFIVKAARVGKNKPFGIISTRPGITLGTSPDYIPEARQYQVALAGRVPTKVTTENGEIVAGDYLTLSSIPGVAAKAVTAGNVIGQALEGYAGEGVGKIEVFVKNSYYAGLSLDEFPGLTTQGMSNPQAILAALENGAPNSVSIPSDITVDRMLASVHIITPKLSAGLISAKVIESPTIDALSHRVTTDIASLQSQISANTGALESLEERVVALEQVESVSSNLVAAVTEGVKGMIESAGEWVVQKITATLAIIERLEVGTAKISEGIEMVDSATGETYCLTLHNNDWKKVLGECGVEVAEEVVVEEEVTPAPEAEPIEEPIAEEVVDEIPEVVVPEEEVTIEEAPVDPDSEN